MALECLRCHAPLTSYHVVTLDFFFDDPPTIPRTSGKELALLGCNVCGHAELLHVNAPSLDDLQRLGPK